MYQLRKIQGPPSCLRVPEAYRHTILTWQEEMAYKENAIVTDSGSGEEKAQRTKKPSYFQSINKPLPSSGDTSTRTQKRSLTAPRSSRKDAQKRREQNRRSAKQAIEDVQPRTHRGGSKPSTTTPQRVGGVTMMRNSVPMADAGHRRDQDLLYLGSQFEDDVPVDEFFELEGWVFLESK